MWSETGHPLIRSSEPGEEWAWCYPDALPLKRSTIDAAVENAQELRGGTEEAGR